MLEASVMPTPEPHCNSSTKSSLCALEDEGVCDKGLFDEQRIGVLREPAEPEGAMCGNAGQDELRIAYGSKLVLGHHPHPAFSIDQVIIVGTGEIGRAHV